MEIRCSHCGETKTLAHFAKQKNRKSGRTSWCLACRNAAARSWRSRLAPERRIHIQRKDNLRKNYGMTHDDYAVMFKDQKGVCAICAQPPADGKNLHVDHDHESGEVRSLLCTKCNTGLGLFDDDVVKMMKAIQYLHRHTRKTEAA